MRPAQGEKTHLLEDQHEPEIYYHSRADYVELTSCGGNAAGTFDYVSGLELDKCFLCVDELNNQQEAGCKATYDWMSGVFNFTVYESLTCNDMYYWLDKTTSSYPSDQCIWNAFQWNMKYWSDSYADPNAGGVTEAFYNTSDTQCNAAPFAYERTLYDKDVCLPYASGEDYNSVMVSSGCEFVTFYSDDQCNEMLRAYPYRVGMNKCMQNDDMDMSRTAHSYAVFPGHQFPLMRSHHERHAEFCGLGEPKKQNVQCVVPETDMIDGSSCTRDMESFYPFHAIPSSTGQAKVCQPHDNDYELRVERASFALDSSTSPPTGMIRVSIKTPDDVESTDRFRVVFRVFDKQADQAVDRKEYFSSFKFNGRPQNKTMTFQLEGPYSPSINVNEMSIKLKQRVYNEDRSFVRKSCVSFPFPPGGDNGNDMTDNDGCCQCPSEYDGHTAWIDNGVCWNGKPEAACDVAGCQDKYYAWYPNGSGLECFQCRSNVMCTNLCQSV